MWFALKNNAQLLTTSSEVVPPQELTCTENGHIGDGYAKSFVFLDEEAPVKAHIVAAQNVGLTQHLCNVTGDL